MSQRLIALDKLNEIIDDNIKRYENEAEEAIQEYSDEERANKNFGKIEGLNDLKIQINEPEEIEDVSQNVQQTINVHDAKKIIDDEL